MHAAAILREYDAAPSLSPGAFSPFHHARDNHNCSHLISCNSHSFSHHQLHEYMHITTAIPPPSCLSHAESSLSFLSYKYNLPCSLQCLLHSCCSPLPFGRPSLFFFEETGGVSPPTQSVTSLT